MDQARTLEEFKRPDPNPARRDGLLGHFLFLLADHPGFTAFDLPAFFDAPSFGYAGCGA